MVFVDRSDFDRQHYDSTMRAASFWAMCAAWYLT